MFITDEIQHFISNNNPNTCKRFYTKLCKLLFKNRILQETNYRCIYCNNIATTLDHIICKSNGGQTLQSNLIGACETCNKSKGTTYWRQWFRQHPNYNEASEEYICSKLKTNKRL